MNELDYLRQMRSLNRPVTPHRDLWADIDARLGEAPVIAQPRRRRAQPWLMAAAIAGVAVLSGGVGLHLARPTGSDGMASTTQPWKPADPRLSGAAVELDAAHMELTQAMKDSPDSPALQRLLLRTERQRDRLRNFEKQAG
ncbi:MAG: hypothetical protein AAGC76_17150 [Luteibacter sp.]|uniref:hypothetical protein n=1 Tax=unclassified Luteibacter TaxID=2620188 RepID=UPI0005BA0105|nr:MULTISPECIES: hypothetical protein [unclassified Luteibacter]MDQ7997572.1 hypothetical protein [Luteibacter sp.]MDQ8047905.1 hypothetical protein [Luteibacter sp.]MDR6642639.1 hypothetical protein [Luteibacter sp. 1214]